MLNYRLLHPQLLAALASSGHGGQLLLADGNYPYTTIRHPEAEVIYLNLSPGLAGISDVLRPLLEATNVEAATFMQSPDGAGVPAQRCRRTRTTGRCSVRRSRSARPSASTSTPRCASPA